MGEHHTTERTGQLLLPLILVLVALFATALPASAVSTSSSVLVGRLEQLSSGGYLVRGADGPYLLEDASWADVDGWARSTVRVEGRVDPVHRTVSGIVAPIERLDTQETLPAVGRWRVLVVRATFSSGLKVTADGAEGMGGINDTDMSAAVWSAGHYIEAASRRRLKVEATVRPGWLETSVPSEAGILALEVEVDRLLRSAGTSPESFDKVVLVNPRSSFTEIGGRRGAVGGWSGTLPANPFISAFEEFAGVVGVAQHDDCSSINFDGFRHPADSCPLIRQHVRGPLVQVTDGWAETYRRGPWGFQLAAAGWAEVGDATESGSYLLSPVGRGAGAPEVLRAKLSDGTSVVVEQQRSSRSTLDDIDLTDLEKAYQKLFYRPPGLWYQILSRGTVATSPNGRFALVNQADGNVVLRDLTTGAVRWSTGTSGHPGATASMLYTRLMVNVGPRVLYDLDVKGALFVTDDGRLEARTDPLHGARPTWDSVRGFTGASASVLNPGERVSAGERLGFSEPYFHVRADGQVRLSGNLGGYSLWASGTSGHPGAYLEMGRDGRVRVRDSDGSVLWEDRGPAVAGSRLVVGDSVDTVQAVDPAGRARSVLRESYETEAGSDQFVTGPTVWHVVETSSGPVATALAVVHPRGWKKYPEAEESDPGEFRDPALGFYLRNDGYDAAGNAMLTIDTGHAVAPGAVSVVGASVRRNQLQASLSVAGPQHRVGYFEVARSATKDQVGRVIGLAGSWGRQVSGLTSIDGNWWLRVRAVAPGGAPGPWSAPFQVQFDSVPPSAPPQLTGRRASRKVELRWAASSDSLSGVDKYAVIRNGQLVAAVEPGQPVSWVSGTRAAGGAFSVVAIDEQGNMSAASVRVVK